MEEGFLITMHLKQQWSEVEAMEYQERQWLLQRLNKWFDERKEAMESEEGGLKIPK